MRLWRNASWKRRLLVTAGGTSLALVLATVVGYVQTDVPSPSSIATAQALQLLYSDGTEMARLGTNRTLVRLDQVSRGAQYAVLAAEDRDFYTEPGISVKGILRALFANVRGGGVEQGGSTITQQYAKNAFLSQQRTITRKIREVFIAVKMSQTVSKARILEDYLNTIYFGRGAYGIEAAATTYFHVHAADLTVAQGAVLASSIRSPAGYDPARHPERAKARWAYVLDGMVKKHWLTQDERSGQVYPKVLPLRTSAALVGDLDHVRDQVLADLARHGFGDERIAAGGLVVTTTIDHTAQDAARKAVASQVAAGKDAPVAALVAVRPGDGAVVAYYGGRTPGGFDYASEGQGVEPGSSMKPYVLAAALEDGKTLATRYDGSSPQRVCGAKVQNDAGDPRFHHIDLVTALAFSVNTVYTRLACDVGPTKVVALAHAAGITTPLAGEGTVSQQVALGSGGYQVHPIDQAVGYATFAAQGLRAAPYFVLKVTDRHGNVVYSAKPDTSQAFSADVAADATFAMQQVVARGTGKRAKIPGRPTAGKTGTTSKNKNAWFCGFTPQLAAAVWMGRPNGGSLTTSAFPNGVYGGTVPAKIFRAFMDAALQGKPVEQFPRSTGAEAFATPTPSPSATGTPTPSPSPSPTGLVSLPPVLPSPSASGTPSASASTTPSPRSSSFAIPTPTS